MPPQKPLPPRRPGKVSVYRAVYAYTAQHGDEVSFEEGDMIYVKEQSDSGWWKATVNGQTGLIPANYVEASGNAEMIDNPLHDAAKRGNAAMVTECLSNNVSVNALDKAGSTPLHWAARGGWDDCVALLLQQPGVAVNVQNKLGDTPLHGAAWKGQASTVSMLLEADADRSVRNNDGLLPFDLAKDPECGRLLQLRAKATGSGAADYGGNESDSD